MVRQAASAGHTAERSLCGLRGGILVWFYHLWQCYESGLPSLHASIRLTGRGQRMSREISPIWLEFHCVGIGYLPSPRKDQGTSMIRHLLDQGTGLLRQLLEHRWLRLLPVLLVVGVTLTLFWHALLVMPTPPTATPGAPSSQLAPTTTPKLPTPTPGTPSPQLRVVLVALAPRDCTPVAHGWSCGDTLTNTGSRALSWKASSTMSGASVAPSSGTLAPRQQLQVTFTLPCVHAGTISFTGPTNRVVVMWACYANG